MSEGYKLAVVGLAGIFVVTIVSFGIVLAELVDMRYPVFQVGACVNVVPNDTDDIVNIYLYPPARGIGRVRSVVTASTGEPIYQIQFAANPEEDTLVLDMGKDSVVVPCKQYEVDVRLYLLQKQIDELEALVRVYGGPNEVSVK